MRLVSTHLLKEGDIIARDIISQEGGVLLRHDTRFRRVFTNKLLERNISEVYIKDKISEGIEPTDAIQQQVRRVIAKDIKTQFDHMKDSFELNMKVLSQVTNLLIEELSGKDLIFELKDLKTNDNYTYEHCIAVAMLTHLVCDKMMIPTEQKKHIVLGALIHDIGKMILPKDILNKPGQLTSEEYALVKNHSEVGYMMIKDNPEIHAITKLIVLCHHEREDGSGYPLGKGAEIHIGAKIVAACDLYHALISNRCYRQGLPINEVIAIAQNEPVNPHIRVVIEQSLAFYPVGCMVTLSDGSIGIVEKNFSADIRRPIVRVITSANGTKQYAYKINLQQDKNYTIVGRYTGPI